MEGHWIRLNRLFSDGKRAVVVAADHGFFVGPTKGSIDLPSAVEAWSEADAILLSPGMLQSCGHAFSYRGAPSAVVRLDWSTVFGSQWGFTGAHTTRVLEPETALAMGADIGMATFTFTMEQELVDRDNVANFARIVDAKRKCGLPLIGELFPIAPDELTASELFRQVHTGCRILAELGADVIKTYFTGDRFEETVEATPVPILVLGAEKLPNEIDALEMARRSIAAGARGVVFGRNIIQSEDPAAMISALRMVIKEGVEPAEAARNAGLV